MRPATHVLLPSPWMGRVGSQRVSDASRGGVISPLGDRLWGETVTPPRSALRFAACEPIYGRASLVPDPSRGGWAPEMPRGCVSSQAPHPLNPLDATSARLAGLAGLRLSPLGERLRALGRGPGRAFRAILTLS